MRTISKTFIGLLRCDRGVAALEFAIVAPLFMLLLVAVMEFGRMYWVRDSVQYAAEQTARWAMVNTAATDSQLKSRALAQFDGVSGGTTPDVSVGRETVNGLSFLTVTITCNFQFLVDFAGVGELPLRGESRVPLI
jgi:Flp pilus assembly protein TadG